MSAQSQNYTLDDFIDHSSVCASCGVDEDPDVSVPADSPVGCCMDLESDSEVCRECFNGYTSVYRAGDER